MSPADVEILLDEGVTLAPPGAVALADGVQALMGREDLILPLRLVAGHVYLALATRYVKELTAQGIVPAAAAQRFSEAMAQDEYRRTLGIAVTSPESPWMRRHVLSVFLTLIALGAPPRHALRTRYWTQYLLRWWQLPRRPTAPNAVDPEFTGPVSAALRQTISAGRWYQAERYWCRGLARGWSLVMVEYALIRTVTLRLLEHHKLPEATVRAITQVRADYRDVLDAGQDTAWLPATDRLWYPVLTVDRLLRQKAFAPSIVL